MHHDRKTLEFEADSDSNNVTLNNREHFALKNLGSGVQATISAIGNRKIRTCTMECYKVSRKCINNRRNEGNSCWSIFSFSFCKFLHNAPYKIILFCHRLGREISWKGTISGIQRLTKKFYVWIYCFSIEDHLIFIEHICEQCSRLPCTHEEYRFSMQERTYPHKS